MHSHLLCYRLVFKFNEGGGLTAPACFLRKVFIMAKEEKKLSDEEGLKLVQQHRKTTHQTKAGGKVVK